jgi:hypothetical protein
VKRHALRHISFFSPRCCCSISPTPMHQFLLAASWLVLGGEPKDGGVLCAVLEPQSAVCSRHAAEKMSG